MDDQKNITFEIKSKPKSNFMQRNRITPRTISSARRTPSSKLNQITIQLHAASGTEVIPRTKESDPGNSE
jgi:hypothetical protein